MSSLSRIALSCRDHGRRGTMIAALSVSLSALLWQSGAGASGSAVELPAPRLASAAPATEGLQTAVLAGGCFWGVEAVFQHLEGVTDVVSGYSGGRASTANYRSVAYGQTRHAEAVRITFDPQRVSYAELLQVYFSVAHDPTELNRQGPDVGPQYRSHIFYADEAQRTVARAYIDQLEEAEAFAEPIVTRLDPLAAFYPAEPYHQNFAYRHPNHRYIVVHDQPKVANLQRLFPEAYRDTPVIVAAQ